MNSDLSNRIQAEVKQSPTMFVGLKALIINEARQVLILKRAKSNTKGETWDIPGGRMGFGEAVDSALQREVQEEAGLTLSHIGIVLDVSTFFRDIDHNSQVVRLICFCKTKDGALVLSEEHSEYKWIPLADRAKYHFMDQNLLDAMQRLEKIIQTHPETLQETFLFPGFVK